MAKPLYQRYPLEDLKKSIQRNHSFYQVLYDMGYKQIYSQTTIDKVKLYCEQHNIDYSHLNETRELEMLQCSMCGKIQPIQNFYQYNNKVQHLCLECKRIKQKEYCQKNIQNLNDYKKTLKCEKCGENRYYLLDFHHKNPKEKKFGIAKQANTKLSTLMSEINKCVVLCSNCHREFHFLSNQNKITLEEYLTD